MLPARRKCQNAPTTLEDVFFLVPRRMRGAAPADGRDVPGSSFAPAAWVCVRKMTEIAVVALPSLAGCDLAWMLRNTRCDFEDNLVIAVAKTCDADYVVTYDRKMLERFPPACITPGQALKLLGMI